MRFLSVIGKPKVTKPTFDDELLHLSTEERLLLQSLNDEQCKMFEKWIGNRKKAQKENIAGKLMKLLSNAGK